MIYHAILQKAREAWDAGYTPNAVRLNGETQKQLRAGFPLLCQRMGTTTDGTKITILETPLGRLRLLYDKHMPDGAFVLTVAIPSHTLFPIREEDAELT